jgi:large repetitive protein
VAHDTSLIVSRWDGVLANDTDGSGDPLTASVIAEPADGTLTFNSSGAFV